MSDTTREIVESAEAQPSIEVKPSADVKPPAEVIAKTYLAFELLQRQYPEQVAEALIRGGKAVNTWYRRLEVLGTFDLGGRKFVRVRTDLENTRPLLQHMLDKGHAVVYATEDGFQVEFPVRRGRISSLAMVGSEASNVKVYKGPKIKGWEEPFIKKVG
jgi:hypothetical protein